jgi:acetoin utilization protein AcuB
MQAHRTLVQDWMTAEPLTVSDDETLIEAYALMRRRGIRRLLVAGADGAICGIVTRSDIEQVMPLAPHGGERAEALFALAGMTVGELMTRDLVSVAPEQTIREAASRLLKAKVSGLPVLRAGRAVGIITESDIFRMVAEGWEAVEPEVFIARD